MLKQSDKVNLVIPLLVSGIYGIPRRYDVLKQSDKVNLVIPLLVSGIYGIPRRYDVLAIEGVRCYSNNDYATDLLN
nr:hypothetical protein [Rickettsia endosymbiont of Ceutorhynchus assimilis]